jgi:nicotinamide-nucleotide adenylyltransferase
LKALLIGRFQPFHKGHLQVIKKILGEVDSLIIVIGSSQHKNNLENPLSADEREEMIKRVLEQEGLKNYAIFQVPDINNDELYPGHVTRSVPFFDVIYTGNDLVRRLFKAAHFKVRKIKHIRRSIYSGSEIRRRIINKEMWKHLVPESVVDYLVEVGALERLKRLST